MLQREKRNLLTDPNINFVSRGNKIYNPNPKLIQNQDINITFRGVEAIKFKYGGFNLIEIYFKKFQKIDLLKVEPLKFNLITTGFLSRILQDFQQGFFN